jgi:hypothetical protein
MPGQIATLVLACQCGKRTIRGLRPDPDYVPAERGSAREVLDWIDAREGVVRDRSRREPPEREGVPEAHEHEWHAVPYDALGQEQVRCAFPDCTALMTRPRVAA